MRLPWRRVASLGAMLLLVLPLALRLVLLPALLLGLRPPEPLAPF